MTEDKRDGELIDYGTAQVQAENLLKGFKGFEHAADVLRSANDARHWLESTAQEIAATTAERDRQKAELEKVKKSVTDAKRLQTAAEENAKQAGVAAKAAEEQSQARVRSADQGQSARVKALEAELEGRRRMLESDMAARKAELDDQIRTKQGEYAKLVAQIEKLRQGLPVPA